MPTPSLHAGFGTFFPRSGAVLLAVTAGAKLLSGVGGNTQALDFPDPLLGLSNRETLILVAAIELGIMAGLVSRISAPMKYLLAAWLGGNFLLYRLALMILQPGQPCKCLGALTEKIHLDDRTAGLLLTLISLYLMAGGLWLYFRHPRPVLEG